MVLHQSLKEVSVRLAGELPEISQAAVTKVWPRPARNLGGKGTIKLSLMIIPANLIAALLTLIPFLGAAFFPEGVAGGAHRLPLWAELPLARDVKAIRRNYSRITAGSGSCARVVSVMAAARMSAPPTQA